VGTLGSLDGIQGLDAEPATKKRNERAGDKLTVEIKPARRPFYRVYFRFTV